jgi:hypothetical protein
LLLVALLSACGGTGASDNSDSADPAGQAEVETDGDAAEELTFVTNSESTDEDICVAGELTIGELAVVEELWQEQRADFAAQAKAWSADAALTQVSVLCWFGDGVELTADFYSPSTDRYFTAPDADESPVGLGETVLDPATVSFAKLSEWLIAAGYDASAVTAGVDLHSAYATAGTHEVPGDAFYYHVGLISSADGDMVSLVVDATTGTVEESAL